MMTELSEDKIEEIRELANQYYKHLEEVRFQERNLEDALFWKALELVFSDEKMEKIHEFLMDEDCYS